MLTSTTILLLSASLQSHAAALRGPVTDGPILLSARIHDRVIPIDLEGDASGTARWTAGQRHLGRHHEPGEGSVSVRFSVGTEAPFGEAPLPLEGGVAAGVYWISALCVLTNPDPLVPALLGCTFTLPVSDPSILAGGGAAGGMLFDLVVADGATIATPFGPMVTMVIDGAHVAELYSDPFSISVPPGGITAMPPAGWGIPIPSMAIPAPVSGIAVDVSAIVTPQDTAILAVLFIISC